MKNLARMAIVLIGIIGLAVSLIVGSSLFRPQAEVMLRSVSSAEAGILEGRTAIAIDIDVDQPSSNFFAELYFAELQITSVPLNARKNRIGPVSRPQNLDDVRIKLKKRFGPFTFENWAHPRRTSLELDSENAAPAPADELSLTAPETVWTSAVFIYGDAPSEASLWYQSRLIEDENGQELDPARPPETGKNFTNYDGRFEGEFELASPGLYEIRVGGTLGRGGPSLATKTAFVRFESELPKIPERRLTLKLSPEHSEFETRIVLLADDPRALSVQSGTTSPRDFRTAMHGQILIDRTIYHEELKQSAPIARDGKVEITQDSGQLDTHAFDMDELSISRWKGELGTAEDDRIIINLENLNVVRAIPRPNTVSKTQLVWTNSMGTLPRDITLQLAHEPAYANGHSSQSFMSRPEILDDIVSLLVSLIPLLWFQKIIARTELSYTGQSASYRVMTMLGVFAAFGSMSYLSGTIGANIYNDYLFSHIGQLSWLSYWMALIISPLLGGLTLLAPAILLRWVTPTRQNGIYVRNALNILVISVCLGTTFNIFRLVTDRSFVSNDSHASITIYAAIVASTALSMIIALALTGRLMKVAGEITHREIKWPLWLPWLLIIGIGLLAFPFGATLETYGSSIQFQLFAVWSGLRQFIERIGFLAVTLSAVMFALYVAVHGHNFTTRELNSAGAALFAGYIIGVGEKWGLVPVAFVIAIFVFGAIVLYGETRTAFLTKYGNEIRENRLRYLQTEIGNAKPFVKSRGWFGFGLVGVKSDDRDKREQYAPLIAHTKDGEKISVSELAFASGVYSTRRQNAVRAVKSGLWGAGFFVIIYVIAPWLEDGDSRNTYPIFSLFTGSLKVTAEWLIGAFIFGYFYENIRGSTAWKKGAVLAFGICLAREPIALFLADNVEEYAPIVLRTLQTFLFYILLGLIAFDARLFRLASGKNRDWRLFPVVTGLSAVEAIASIVVAGAGIAVTTAFTAQLTDAITEVAGEFIQPPSATPDQSPSQFPKPSSE